MDDHKLIEMAISVRAQAYAPYSLFQVGAALVTPTGECFVGCNVENSSYGLSICAERNAIGQMISAGQKEISKIAVAASPLASPCGACRQCIVEFGTAIEIICVDANRPAELKRWNIAELIPDFFHFKNREY